MKKNTPFTPSDKINGCQSAEKRWGVTPQKHHLFTPQKHPKYSPTRPSDKRGQEVNPRKKFGDSCLTDDERRHLFHLTSAIPHLYVTYLALWHSCTICVGIAFLVERGSFVRLHQQSGWHEPVRRCICCELRRWLSIGE